MCLRAVKEHFKVSDKKTVLAWKLFSQVRSEVAETAIRKTEVSLNKINNAPSELLVASNNEKYKSGFHAYATKRAAEFNVCDYITPQEIVLPVVLECVTSEGVEGYNWGWKVYVAKKMRVLRTVQEARAYMKAKEKKA